MNSVFKPAVTFCAVLALSGCSILPESEPPRIVGLDDNAPVPVYDHARSVSLRVDTPLASAPFDTNLVLIQPENWEYQALPDTRWRDSMPAIIHDRLIKALRQSRGFDRVLSATSPAEAEYTLLSELNGFHARRNGDDTTVTIDMHLEVMNNRTRETRCSTEKTLDVAAGDARLDSLMVAFSDAGTELSRRTAAWAFACLQP
ncbi:cholesterol transport system auxiliary component [Marinobacter persicus]|uniref:Cholesterol transport system auxiliary component n=1 Tax=Marinobacter persicus TaxID=930118 RepID=A0A1I3WCW5_9GAMM|nr:ABC-type transport auxiliary lipoprotein family protein [Marinobacter persicus]GHD47342.1 hypothetical protein GCM10008110_15170 [Marinobacter persicus]SFK05250.1 cholesterol transport system auxiliary component [Marinobacter persicus]